MGYEYLNTEERDGVFIVTLNDPATRNAMSPELYSEFAAAIDEFSADPNRRVLIITGAEPSFCSGANIRNMQRTLDQKATQGEAAEPLPTPWEQLDPSRTGRLVKGNSGPPVILKLYHLQKPTIAAVNGPAYGIGAGIALACDFRIVSEKARFSEAFVRNGMIPGDGSCWHLPRLIGVDQTLLMQYTGDPVGAEDAARMGMVTKLVPHEQLLEAALDLGVKLAKGATYSMALIKLLVQKAQQQTLEEHLADATLANQLARQTEDHKEGVRAFLEKRQPVFKGR